MENERRYRRRNSDVKEENMESSEQEPRTVRHEYGSSSAGDSIGQARRVIDELEARINDARRVPMSKTLSIIDTGELIDLIGQLRIVLPHTVVQARPAGDVREVVEDAEVTQGKLSLGFRTGGASLTGGEPAAVNSPPTKSRRFSPSYSPARR